MAPSIQFSLQPNKHPSRFRLTTAMASNALDPSAILSNISSLLPGDKTLKSPQDALAILLHSVMSILGFRLVGLDDASSDVQYDKNILPSEWSKSSPDSFGFRYRHDQSSLVFFLKLVKLSKRLVIHGIALEVPITSILGYLHCIDCIDITYRRMTKLQHLIFPSQTSRPQLRSPM